MGCHSNHGDSQSLPATVLSCLAVSAVLNRHGSCEPYTHQQAGLADVKAYSVFAAVVASVAPGASQIVFASGNKQRNYGIILLNIK